MLNSLLQRDEMCKYSVDLDVSKKIHTTEHLFGLT